MLKSYNIFHLNLMYSSIDVKMREKVLKKCYWPLLELIDEIKVPFGIESSGITLEIISSLDAEWIAKLRNLIEAGLVEFIGSGYSQIIGPLVPENVNDWNQKLGFEVYIKLLGVRPKIALVNEMAYSSGIVEHYINHNYNAIIMEWNNPRKYHPEWSNEWRYFPQKVSSTDGRSVPIIWADSIGFQKFQRYAHGEYDLEEYVKTVTSQSSPEKDRNFPLYANDTEIFDFRPGRYKTETPVKGSGEEWKRIRKLFDVLKNMDDIRFIFPSEVLSSLTEEEDWIGNTLSLESPEEPIPVKKQEKYNINRWALTGRDDYTINTKCYQIFKGLKEKGSKKSEDWKELCYLWSSDFRTHLTEERWVDYIERLNIFKEKWSIENISVNVVETPGENTSLIAGKDIVYNETEKQLVLNNPNCSVVLNKMKGLTVESCIFHQLGEQPIFGTLTHGYYDDISLGADYFSEHAIIERPGKDKITDLAHVFPSISYQGDEIIVTSEQEHEGILFQNEITLHLDRLVLRKRILIMNKKLEIIRPMNFTFLPKAWKENTLVFKTHNGGKLLESFNLKNNRVQHTDIHSALISSKHALGATEGVIILGDEKSSLSFEHVLGESALIPRIFYKPGNGGPYFLRLQYSAQEVDDTFKTDNSPQQIYTSITIRPIVI